MGEFCASYYSMFHEEKQNVSIITNSRNKTIKLTKINFKLENWGSKTHCTLIII